LCTLFLFFSSLRFVEIDREYYADGEDAYSLKASTKKELFKHVSSERQRQIEEKEKAELEALAAQASKPADPEPPGKGGKSKRRKR
jgi:hypothetical protein